MADLGKDFELYFANLGLLEDFAFGIDIMQHSPDAAISVYEYSGGGGAPQIAGAARSMQVVVRHSDPYTAKVKADALYHALDTDDGIIHLTPERWGALTLLQTSFKMRTDESDRVYYGFNLSITTYID
ncbi:hypothetical protein D3C76_574920 [compost metagenome]